MKQTNPFPVDGGTPSTQIPPISVDVKKNANVRDSGFLDDEDLLSGRDSELATSRILQNKLNETAPEDTSTPTDLINRKIKSTRKKINF